MKDKLYRKLNKEKPSPRVLDAAYAEMDNQSRENARSRKREPRTVLRWALASVCSIILIVVVALAIGNPDFGMGCNSAYKDSAQSPSDNNSANDESGNHAGSDDESETGFVVTDDYFTESADGLGGSIVGSYIGKDEESVTVYKLNFQYAIDDKVTAIPGINVTVNYRMAEDGYEAAFTSDDGVNYYINSTIKDEILFLRFIHSIEFR